jgi:hypothetical protein
LAIIGLIHDVIAAAIEPVIIGFVEYIDERFRSPNHIATFEYDSIEPCSLSPEAG